MFHLCAQPFTVREPHFTKSANNLASIHEGKAVEKWSTSNPK